MSSSNKPGQPPDLIEVFKTIASVLKKAQKTQKASRSAGRPTRADTRPRGAQAADRTTASSEGPDFEFHQERFEILRGNDGARRAAELDLDMLDERLSSSKEALGPPADPALSGSAGDHRFHRKRMQDLLDRLRDPRSVREAIIVKELLDKPVAMRRHRR